MEVTFGVVVADGQAFNFIKTHRKRIQQGELSAWGWLKWQQTFVTTLRGKRAAEPVYGGRTARGNNC